MGEAKRKKILYLLATPKTRRFAYLLKKVSPGMQDWEIVKYLQNRRIQLQ